MVLFNYSTRELTTKIVYYGPGLCGKTTNLQFVHANLPETVRGKMLSLSTKTDRTLFFDFLPIDLGEIRGMRSRVQLYTVPGQVFYNETRRLVLKGADGLVFVADSQQPMLGANIESYRNLEENLKAHGLNLAEIPHVLQFNKRDLPKVTGIEELNAALNRYNAPFYESVATTGIGVQDTLRAIVKLVLLHLTQKYEAGGKPAAADRGFRSPATERTNPVEPAPRPSAPVTAGAASAARSQVGAPPRSQVAPAATIPLSDYPSATPASPAEADSIPEPVDASRPGGAPRRDLPPPPDFRGTAGPDGYPVEAGNELNFDDDEIDRFVDEVDRVTIEPPPPEEPPSWALETPEDHVFGGGETPPPWTGEAPPETPAEPAGTVTTATAATTEVEAPGAHVRIGDGQEVTVPVELEVGGSLRRFEITIAVRLTPKD